MAELVHGRASTYNNYKCRCDECRKAWADYIREGGYVRRYQEKKRKEREAEKLQKVEKSATISLETMDMNDPEHQEAFLKALKEYGVPITDDGETT